LKEKAAKAKFWRLRLSALLGVLSVLGMESSTGLGVPFRAYPLSPFGPASATWLLGGCAPLTCKSQQVHFKRSLFGSLSLLAQGNAFVVMSSTKITLALFRSRPLLSYNVLHGVTLNRKLTQQSYCILSAPSHSRPDFLEDARPKQ
jgi:hypothetical protein